MKKYLDPRRDIYIHTQIHGSTSTVIKNPKGNVVPYQTLSEAGCFCACRSNAWKNKISVETYWVYGYQISKIPKSGEYLLNGSFIIRGKKNFIPSQPLIMGLGLLFVIDKESFELRHYAKVKLKNHLNELNPLINRRKNSNVEYFQKNQRIKKNNFEILNSKNIYQYIFGEKNQRKDKDLLKDKRFYTLHLFCRKSIFNWNM